RFAAVKVLPQSFDGEVIATRRQPLSDSARNDPAHTAFDVLRTRLLQALSDNGWRRVAITSPSKDCGKTFTAANLAISLSRQENCRTLLLDCDMRRPSLHRVMGVPAPGAIGDMLRGHVDPREHLLRMGQNSVHAGRNIAFGFNAMIEPYASELLQDPRAVQMLDRIEDMYEPDVMLFDLPPALFYDDVIAFRPQFDGVLLVIGGGLTTEKEVREVERRLGDQTPLLGMVLNKAEGTEHNKYRY
nr:CpsD/CapB family tyrosine-protein kinase [Paracoccaceae bacterium]